MRKASFAVHDTESLILLVRDKNILCPVGHNVEESSGMQEGGVCSTGGYTDKYWGQVEVRSCDHHVTVVW